MKHLHQKFVTSEETIDGVGMTKVHDLKKNDKRHTMELASFVTSPKKKCSSKHKHKLMQKVK